MELEPTRPPSRPANSRIVFPKPSGGSRRLLAGLAVLVLAVMVVTAWGSIKWPSLNPFTTTETDRTGASVVHSLKKINEFHAAKAHYETVVDIDRDTRFVPDWISGERVLYVAKGQVDGYVDFSELDEDRVTMSDDRTMVTVKLPAPRVADASLDVAGSYVFTHDEGIITKFKGSDLEREAQLKGIEQMNATARGEDALLDMTKDNTEAMLRGLLGSLGFTSVTITFD